MWVPCFSLHGMIPGLDGSGSGTSGAGAPPHGVIRSSIAEASTHPNAGAPPTLTGTQTIGRAAQPDSMTAMKSPNVHRSFILRLSSPDRGRRSSSRIRDPRSSSTCKGIRALSSPPSSCSRGRLASALWPNFLTNRWAKLYVPSPRLAESSIHTKERRGWCSGRLHALDRELCPARPRASGNDVLELCLD